MKITRKQLRDIIKEELEAVMGATINEGFMDTLNYLFTGATPSELELAQRELDKALAKAKQSLSVPAMDTEMPPIKMPPINQRAALDRKRRAEKLAQMKRDKGLTEGNMKMLEGEIVNGLMEMMQSLNMNLAQLKAAADSLSQMIQSYDIDLKTIKHVIDSGAVQDAMDMLGADQSGTMM